MKCAQCGSTERLTIDHIIPKWLYKRIDSLGIKKNFKKQNQQILCYSCNNKKGGKPDFHHPVAKELREKLLDLLNPKRN